VVDDQIAANGEHPAETNGEHPAETNGHQPVKTNGEHPAETKGERPAETNGQHVAETNGHQPVKTNGEHPAETKGERPVEEPQLPLCEGWRCLSESAYECASQARCARAGPVDSSSGDDPVNEPRWIGRWPANDATFPVGAHNGHQAATTPPMASPAEADRLR
jgi:hypothetical protein